MTRILLTACASLTLMGPLAISSADAQYQGQYQGDRQGQYQGDRQGQYQGDRQGQYQGQHQGDQNAAGDQRRDYGDRDRRDDRDNRREWREQRADARWDEHQHNGYYYNNRWYFGPPPADYYGRSGFALGYRPWSPGQRLGYFHQRYGEVDYRSERLRRPPRGYHWVRDDRGNLILAALATGFIAQVIINANR